MKTNIVRTYKRFDVLDSVGDGVAHLSYLGEPHALGSWYSLCGRVVVSYRRESIEDTDHESVCKSCDAKASKWKVR